MIKNLQTGTICNVFDYTQEDFRNQSDTIVLSLKEEKGALIVSFTGNSSEDNKDLILFSEDLIDLKDCLIIEFVLFKSDGYSYNRHEYYGFINGKKCYVLDNTNSIKIINKEFPNKLKILAFDSTTKYFHLIQHGVLQKQYSNLSYKIDTDESIIQNLGFAVSLDVNTRGRVIVNSKICEESSYVDYL